MRKCVPILSVVSWLGAMLIITREAFSHVVWVMGRFDPTIPVYCLCGILVATAAHYRSARWARLASFALSIPAAAWALLGLLSVFRFLLPTTDTSRPDTVFFCGLHARFS